MIETLDLFVIVILIVALIVGVFLGIVITKISIKRKNKEELKNAQEVLDGKRDNFIEVDGIKYDATKFRMEGEDGKEIIIDLKGGYKKYDGEKKHKKEKGNNPKETPECPRKDSRSRREKKRNIGRISRRIRRFG